MKTVALEKEILSIITGDREGVYVQDIDKTLREKNIQFARDGVRSIIYRLEARQLIQILPSSKLIACKIPAETTLSVGSIVSSKDATRTGVIVAFVLSPKPFIVKWDDELETAPYDYSELSAGQI